MGKGLIVLEKLTTKEKLALKLTTIGVIGGLALTGCSASAQEQVSSNDLLPIDRYGLDYMGVQDCLVGTPYSVYTEYNGFVVSRPRNPAAVSYESARDIFTASPYGGGPALKLTGFKQEEETVHALTVGDQSILDAYGCETIIYAEQDSKAIR